MFVRVEFIHFDITPGSGSVPKRDCLEQGHLLLWAQHLEIQKTEHRTLYGMCTGHSFPTDKI